MVGALSLDVGGVLLHLRRPVAETYQRFTGSERSQAHIARAFAEAWRDNPHRMVGDARPFWRHLVVQATGVVDEDRFEALYAFYETAEAWDVLEGAAAWLADPPVPVVLCSNWDTRLRRTLDAVGLPPLPTVCSGEEGVEKPAAALYRRAAQRLGRPVDQLLHVDDDAGNVQGAILAGAQGLRWGVEACTLQELAAIVRP